MQIPDVVSFRVSLLRHIINVSDNICFLVSDVLGKASRLILQAIVEGETDAKRLASFAVGRVRADQQTLERALTGKVSAHHRFMLSQHLALIEHLDEAIRRVTEEIARRFTPPEPPTQEENQPSPAPAPTETEPVPSSQEAGPPSWQEAAQIIEQVTGESRARGSGFTGRNRRRDEPVSFSQTSGILGGHLPRHP